MEDLAFHLEICDMINDTKGEADDGYVHPYPKIGSIPPMEHYMFLFFLCSQSAVSAPTH